MNKLILFCLAGFCSLNVFGQKDPATTELWDPVPPVVTPGQGTEAPSDAIILFNGKDLGEWLDSKGAPAAWDIKEGAMTVTPGKGGITTKRSFSDCQLHIEFRTPAEVKGESQGRGNSGIFLMDRYEIQVLDCYENLTYSNGQTGSVYKQFVPLVNVCKKPGEWQVYDIIFTAPRFGESGRIVLPGTVTVLQNGVLVQNHVNLVGPTEYIGLPKVTRHESKLPISLQDHGNPVSYRNIWIREL